MLALEAASTIVVGSAAILLVLRRFFAWYVQRQKIRRLHKRFAPKLSLRP